MARSLQNSVGGRVSFRSVPYLGMVIRGGLGYVAVVWEAKCLTDLGRAAFRPAAR